MDLTYRTPSTTITHLKALFRDILAPLFKEMDTTFAHIKAIDDEKSVSIKEIPQSVIS